MYDSAKKRSPGEVEFINPHFLDNHLLVDYIRGGLELKVDFLLNYSTDTTNSIFKSASASQNPYLVSIDQIMKVIQPYTQG